MFFQSGRNDEFAHLYWTPRFIVNSAEYIRR